MLLLQVAPRHRESNEAARSTWLRMEFKTFVNEVVKVLCQIVRQGRQVIHLVQHWNQQLPSFFRLATAMNCCERPGRREKSPAIRATFPSERRAPLDDRLTGSANQKPNTAITPTNQHSSPTTPDMLGVCAHNRYKNAEAVACLRTSDTSNRCGRGQFFRDGGNLFGRQHLVLIGVSDQQCQIGQPIDLSR